MTAEILDFPFQSLPSAGPRLSYTDTFPLVMGIYGKQSPRRDLQIMLAKSMGGLAESLERAALWQEAVHQAYTDLLEWEKNRIS